MSRIEKNAHKIEPDHTKTLLDTGKQDDLLINYIMA